MILGVDELLKLVKEIGLVENLCDRELNNPEGAGFDLRLGEVYKLTSKGFLGVEERKTCDVELVNRYDHNQKSNITLKPGDFYTVKTIEKVNLPPDLVAILKPRSTLQRMGISLRTSQVNPGYSGELIFGIKNFGNQEVEIEMGSRIVHIMFVKVHGRTNLYRGQWQGGRVSTETKEKQI